MATPPVASQGDREGMQKESEMDSNMRDYSR